MNIIYIKVYHDSKYNKNTVFESMITDWKNAKEINEWYLKYNSNY